MEETADACMVQKRGGKSLSGSMMMLMLMLVLMLMLWCERTNWTNERTKVLSAVIFVGCVFRWSTWNEPKKDVGFPFWAASWAALYSSYPPMYKLLFFTRSPYIFSHCLRSVLLWLIATTILLPSQKLLFAYFIFHRIFILHRIFSPSSFILSLIFF